MKVLFAVSNEEISESIVKRYQKEYKEIISYKNVYYFNAIIKELQKDKSYDRVVISEDLEAFSNTQYAQIDKFIFDKLDSISDEAVNQRGDDIPILLIASDRRQKSEEMLTKLFGIGIYDVLLGNDRSFGEVCKLLNKPRTKKEAKLYYKIESDDVNYQSEDENDVSEIEIQNILAHYKRLGKDEKKYVESFDNIASQYNDTQLKLICKFLPLNVKAVLEEKSPKYQKIISYNNKISKSIKNGKNNAEANEQISEKLLKTSNNEKILSKQVVIPTSVDMNSTKKLAKVKNKVKSIETADDVGNQVDKPNDWYNNNTQQYVTNDIDQLSEQESMNEVEKIVEPKRRRGRPRKITPQDVVVETNEESVKKRRGRPRKIENENQYDYQNVNKYDSSNIENSASMEDDEEMVLPGINETNEIEENDDVTLPGIEENGDSNMYDEQDETVLPGINDEFSKNYESNENMRGYNVVNRTSSNINANINSSATLKYLNRDYSPYQDVDISNFVTSDKKIASFVGTTKNGTSFIVNNLAYVASSMGINTAIFDATGNRNSYYIYTQNDENLRKIAMSSVNNLLQGIASGIQVNKTLTVYTSLPTETDGIENASIILKTLLKKHSLILIDCDFTTPIDYFRKAQEIYLVQSLDILTIQPLTAFLRELKSKGVLQQEKLKIILNKVVELKGVNDKVIIGGMAYYNDPSMSFMTELFDKQTIKYMQIPFNEEVYIKYLENIVNCEVSIKGYPKNIVQCFNELSNMVYPINSGKSYVPPSIERNGFTPEMNSTLNQMKKRY